MSQKNSKQYQLIKETFISLKEELDEDIKSHELSGNSFGVFFAGYFAGKRNNLEILPKLMDTLQEIINDLEEENLHKN